jgi:hypothetical protein
MHDQVTRTCGIHDALKEAFISTVVGDYRIVQSETGYRGRTSEDHNGASRAGALVATEGGICDLQSIVGEDRATCIGAVIGRSSIRYPSRHIIVVEGAIADLGAATGAEYGPAQCPAATAVVIVGTAAEGPPSARVGKPPNTSGPAAPSKPTVPTRRREKSSKGPTAATTAETAISTIAPAAAATTAVATRGAVSLGGEDVARINAARIKTATTTAGTRTGWLMAVVPKVPTTPAAAKPAGTLRTTCSISAGKNRSATATGTLMYSSARSSAAIAARTAAAAETLAAAVARQSSSASSVECGATTVAADCSVVLEGAVFDCEITIDINRATRAQAAGTTITALDVEAFDVNVSQQEIPDA